MTELDFDELDKAVNNLMKEATQPQGEDSPSTMPQQQGNSTTSEPLEIIPDTKASEANMVPALPQPSVSTPPAPVRQPNVDASAGSGSHQGSTPLAMKRRGRFMDVVHPSSDMKASNAPVKRVGATLQPMTAQPPASQESKSPDEEAVNIPAASNEEGLHGSEPEANQPSYDTSHLDAPKNEYPDPITLQMEREATNENEEQTFESPEVPPSEDPESASTVGVEGGEVVQDNISVATSEAKGRSPQDEEDAVVPERPLTSPFLPDAKVEKRPLGAPLGDAATTAAEPVVAAQDDSAARDAQMIAEQKEETEVPLPAELSGAVMVVESSESVRADASPTNTADTSAVPQPQSHSDDQTSSGAGSIPQQYKEQPSSTPAASGAIYDTQTYHHPLDHPAKKKSGLGVVIWILVLLILGALAGAAYFYLKMR